MIVAAADDPCEMSGSLSDRCLRDGLRRISRVAQAEVGRGGAGGGGAAAASIARMRGCEDVRPSVGPTSPPGTERVCVSRESRESRPAEGGGALWRHMETHRNVPYESCGIVDRQHHRIYTFGKRVAYLTFLPGVHSTRTCVDHGPGEGTSHSFILATTNLLGRSFLLWC